MITFNQAAKNGLSALEPVDKTVLTIDYHEKLKRFILLDIRFIKIDAQFSKMFTKA